MTLATAWFVLVALMLAVYVVLDGFDLGAGILHPWLGRNEGERGVVLRAVGPVWDGNEVWLIAGGATLYFAFPKLYATSFSGFYLPLIIVLWLLVFRAIGIELRHHATSKLWTDACDFAFAAASLLLAAFFGAALGNVVRGVPLDEAGTFFEPLWTDFRVGDETGILDWYTILVAVHATVALVMHGALWLAYRAVGDIRRRARRAAGAAWLAVLPLTAATTVATFAVQPRLAHNLEAHPVGLVFPGLAVAGLVAIPLRLRRRRHRSAFFGSVAYLLGMLTSAAYGIYPYVLPARDPQHGLTLHEAATHPEGLALGLWWWVPGMLLAVGYFVFLYTHLPKDLSPEDGPAH
ncbi:MAG: cytochrome d ubiquinol oxidase subunit II [Myxococcota bacterium]